MPLRRDCADRSGIGAKAERVRFASFGPGEFNRSALDLAHYPELGFRRACRRIRSSGDSVAQGPDDTPNGTLVSCVDPTSAIFKLQGPPDA